MRVYICRVGMGVWYVSMECGVGVKGVYVRMNVLDKVIF